MICNTELICLSSVIVCLLILLTQGSVSGYTGKEVVISLGNAQSFPVNATTNNRIIVNVNYSTSDTTLVGQKINAVMKVHTSNGTVIKTTSFPSGFIANKTDSARMVTNVPKSYAHNVTTEIVFMDLSKINTLSNIVKVQPVISGSIK